MSEINSVVTHASFKNWKRHQFCSDSYRDCYVITTERGHHTDGWLLHARLCACLQISPESDSAQTLLCSLRWDYKLRSPLCVYTLCKKIILCTLTILKFTLEFRGLWKQQNNPACAKSARDFKWWSCTQYGSRRRHSVKKNIYKNCF